MNDSTETASNTPAATPKKKRESAPWHIYTITDDRCANLKAQGLGPFKDLRDAEQAAAKQAAADIGTVYAPVKVGQRFKAEKTERVEVRKS